MFPTDKKLKSLNINKYLKYKVNITKGYFVGQHSYLIDSVYETTSYRLKIFKVNKIILKIISLKFILSKSHSPFKIYESN